MPSLIRNSIVVLKEVTIELGESHMGFIDPRGEERWIPIENLVLMWNASKKRIAVDWANNMDPGQRWEIAGPDAEEVWEFLKTNLGLGGYQFKSKWGVADADL